VSSLAGGRQALGGAVSGGAAYFPGGERGRIDVQAGAVSASVALRRDWRGGLRQDLELFVLVQVRVAAPVEQLHVVHEARRHVWRHGAAV